MRCKQIPLRWEECRVGGWGLLVCSFKNLVFELWGHNNADKNRTKNRGGKCKKEHRGELEFSRSERSDVAGRHAGVSLVNPRSLQGGAQAASGSSLPA